MPQKVLAMPVIQDPRTYSPFCDVFSHLPGDRGLGRLRPWLSELGDQDHPNIRGRSWEGTRIYIKDHLLGGGYGGTVLRQDVLGHLCHLSFFLGLPEYIFQIHSLLHPSSPLPFFFPSSLLLSSLWLSCSFFSSLERYLFGPYSVL